MMAQDTPFERIAQRVERGWCRGASARTAAGAELENVADPTAARWCLAGAIDLEAPADYERVCAAIAAHLPPGAEDPDPTVRVILYYDDVAASLAEVAALVRRAGAA